MTREREVGTVGWSLKGDERQKLRQSIIWPLCIPVSCILRFFIFFIISVIIRCLLPM